MSNGLNLFLILLDQKLYDLLITSVYYTTWLSNTMQLCQIVKRNIITRIMFIWHEVVLKFSVENDMDMPLITTTCGL